MEATNIKIAEQNRFLNLQERYRNTDLQSATLNNYLAINNYSISDNLRRKLIQDSNRGKKIEFKVSNSVIVDYKIKT